jgi:hypothetical protein
MTEMNPDQITGTLAITVLPQANGQYVCRLASALSDAPRADIQCYGQSKEHAIAIALEQLAAEYRQMAQAQQSSDWLAVERSASGTPIDKRYHVILHYEDVTEDESMFEARHNTIMGNTVVENAKITVIEIDADLPVEPVGRSWE